MKWLRLAGRENALSRSVQGWLRAGGLREMDDAGDHRRIDAAGELLPVDVEREVRADHPALARGRVPQRRGDRGDQPLAAEVEVEAGIERLALRAREVEAEVELVGDERRPLGRGAELAAFRDRRAPAPLGIGRLGEGDQRAVLGQRVEPHHPGRPAAGERRQGMGGEEPRQLLAQGEEMRRRRGQEAVRGIRGIGETRRCRPLVAG